MTTHEAPRRSPGLETDRLVQPMGVEVHERGSYFALRTPERTDYLSGNLLGLGQPLRGDGLDDWLRYWRQEFAALPRVTQVLVQWETDLSWQPDTTLTDTRGAVLSSDIVLGLSQLAPLQHQTRWSARPFASKGNWHELLAMTVEDEGTDQADFLHWLLTGYRRTAESGRAVWWGVWQGGQLLASAGVFLVPCGIRLEEVRTAAAHRRQGLCTFLCHDLCSAARRRDPSADVWVVTEETSDAVRIYRALGFVPVSRRWTFRCPRPVLEKETEVGL